MDGERGSIPQFLASNHFDRLYRSSRLGRGPARNSLLLAVFMALAGGAVLAGAAMFCFVVFLSHAAAPGAGETPIASRSPMVLAPLPLGRTSDSSVTHSSDLPDTQSLGPGTAKSAPVSMSPVAPADAQGMLVVSVDRGLQQHSAMIPAADEAGANVNVLPPGAMPSPLPRGADVPAANLPPGAMPADVILGGKIPAEARPGGAMAGGEMPAAGAAMPAEPIPVANARLRRRMLVLGEGGTADSERAVEAGLVWLAQHQMADGGWSFNHQLDSCAGQCPNPGVLADARIGATAMALLPFLAAGYSYDEGPYQQEVTRGLLFLISHMGGGGSLWESGGTMYSHGLATLALCDAYNLGPKLESSPGEIGVAGQRGKTNKLAEERAARAEAAKILKAAKASLAKPRKAAAEEAASPGQAASKLKIDPGFLGAAAQAALDFIVASQDPLAGGWRYQPRQPGDTSVVGWQIMALKAGQKAQLRVPAVTLANGARFLDAVQVEYGAGYGYTSPMRGTPATTAIGLLARMNLGWDQSHPGLAAGVQNLATFGPSQGDMYFNFYASQVLRNFGGPLYERWNPIMRDFLVQNQGKQGHLAGSWQFTGGHGATAGGRLYNTALCTLILEVYYRYQPIYPSPSVSPGDTAAAEEAARPKNKAPAID